jgi:hypothetical protein
MAPKRPKTKRVQVNVEVGPIYGQALDEWVNGHGADKMTVCRVGAFLFMRLPEARRLEALKAFSQWADEGYESSWLDWPPEDQRY